MLCHRAPFASRRCWYFSYYQIENEAARTSASQNRSHRFINRRETRRAEPGSVAVGEITGAAKARPTALDLIARRALLMMTVQARRLFQLTFNLRCRTMKYRRDRRDRAGRSICRAAKITRAASLYIYYPTKSLSRAFSLPEGLGILSRVHPSR